MNKFSAAENISGGVCGSGIKAEIFSLDDAKIRSEKWKIKVESRIRLQPHADIWRKITYDKAYGTTVAAAAWDYMRYVCQSQSRWSAANFLCLNTSSSFESSKKLFAVVMVGPGCIAASMKSRRIICSFCLCEMWKIITVSIICYNFFPADVSDVRYFAPELFKMFRLLSFFSLSFFLRASDADNRLHAQRTLTFHLPSEKLRMGLMNK